MPHPHHLLKGCWRPHLGCLQQEPLAETGSAGLGATGSAGNALLGSCSEAAVQLPLSHHDQCLASAHPLSVWQCSRGACLQQVADKQNEAFCVLAGKRFNRSRLQDVVVLLTC